MTYEELIPIKGVVKDVINEAPSIKTFLIEVEGSYRKPAPGQFNEVYVPGVGEVPISVSDYLDDDLVAHTVRAVGSVTNVLIDISVGETVGIRGPYGKGWPLSKFEGKDILIVAGGLGLAPLRPVIREVERNRPKFGKLTILYGARTPQLLLYKYEFNRYKSIPNSEFVVTVDKPDPTWDGCVGVVTTLFSKVKIHTDRSVALICGPEIMMKYAVKGLIELGFGGNQIYLSLERRMKCGIGLCGHCQLGPFFVCKEGPVFPYWVIKKYFWVDQI